MTQNNISDIPAPSTLTVLECPEGRILTKRFAADGTKHDFTAGYLMRVHELPAGTWAELIAALTLLVECPTMCIIRGKPKDDCPRAEDIDVDPWVYRRKKERPGEPANFDAVAQHWVVYDFDDTATPFDVAAPEVSIRAWHRTLPIELHAAESAFFPSASAHTSATVRGKLVTWYKRPVSESRARAYAIHYHADPSVANAVQPNYFAAPVFDGCADPLAGKRKPVHFHGTEYVVPPRVEALEQTKARPAPVASLAELPPGDAGIVAALGPQEELVGLRFAIVGQLGGLMRKCGFTNHQCASVVREWIPAADLAPRLDWALGAWRYPAETVSGLGGLRALVGDAHAQIIYEACLAARRSTKVQVSL